MHVAFMHSFTASDVDLPGTLPYASYYVRYVIFYIFLLSTVIYIYIIPFLCNFLEERVICNGQ